MRSDNWILLVLSLPSQHATSRMRIWRALKSMGAGVMRDGVYLMPSSDEHRHNLAAQADAVRATGGTAYLVDFESQPADSADLRGLFDRGAEYESWQALAHEFQAALIDMTEAEARRQWAQLNRQFQAIVTNDFFPGRAQDEAARSFQEIQAAFNRRFSPGEPQPSTMTIQARELRDYQGRLWATRARPWVDRLASAWLIRRFVDHAASFLWLKDTKDCPANAVGFDFDGAEFTHVGDQVSFEVLAESFGLMKDPALMKLGALVHYLDVGGAPVAEAAGFTALLTGMRSRIHDDDAMLHEASRVLDDLYAAYQAAN